MLSIKNLVHVYGNGTRALDDVSLEVPRGMFGLLGPNGAGKSTLLALLATLDRPTSGRITFGEAVDAVQQRWLVRPHVGVVAHETLVYAELTGRENLEFCADLNGVARGRVDDWLDRVGLVHGADKPVATYSRGMRQRLAIARALLTEPTIVLLDEPLTGLDAGGRALLAETVRWLRQEERVVVMVTHHLDWPHHEVDRALVLDQGRLRYDGPSDAAFGEVYARGVAP